MASIHIKEIMEYLSNKGEGDALVHHDPKEGFFLEIRFDDTKMEDQGAIDEEYQNKVIAVDCPYGCVTILFDNKGQLKSLDIS